MLKRKVRFQLVRIWLELSDNNKPKLFTTNRVEFLNYIVETADDCNKRSKNYLNKKLK